MKKFGCRNVKKHKIAFAVVKSGRKVLLVELDRVWSRGPKAGLILYEPNIEKYSGRSLRKAIKYYGKLKNGHQTRLDMTSNVST